MHKTRGYKNYNFFKCLQAGSELYVLFICYNINIVDDTFTYHINIYRTTHLYTIQYAQHM